nr:unnamed protein product [Callosobruchus analis]
MSSIPQPEPQHDCMSAAAKNGSTSGIYSNSNKWILNLLFGKLMLYLSIAPQKVYKNFHCRKQTKSQFARDGLFTTIRSLAL